MFNSGIGFTPFYGAASATKQGLFSALKTKFNWSAILNGTQKTLNIVNQAIPLVYQVKPMVNNVKTVFKIIGAIKDDDTTQKYNQTPSVNTSYNNSNTATTSKTNSISKNVNTQNYNQPNFFL